jgi:tetratricopeptide (TPR) repeat protein
MGFDHPWLGTGPGTYASASRAYQDTAGFYSINAHNFYLQTFGEMGFLGLAAWAALLIGVVWAVRGARRETPEQRAPNMALSAGLLASLLHIAFDLDWSVLAIPVAFWLVAGMLLGAVAPPAEVAESGRLSRLIRLAAALALIVVPARSSIGSRQIQRADRMAATGQAQEALALYARAQRALPWPSASVAGSEAQLRMALGQSDAAATAIDQACRLDRLNGAYWLQKAEMRAADGDWQGAVMAGEKAVMLNPYRHPQPYLVLARWYDRLKKPEVALAWLETGEHRFPVPTVQSYQIYTPGDLYELFNLLQAKGQLTARMGRPAVAAGARKAAAEIEGMELLTPGVPEHLATPLRSIRSHWAAYAAHKPLTAVLPGGQVPAPPAGLPAGDPQWFWLERDIASARVIYTRPGVTAHLIDELELRDAGWLIVRRTGQTAAEVTP